MPDVVVEAVAGQAFPNKYAETTRWLEDHYDQWVSLCRGDDVTVPEATLTFLGSSAQEVV